jgi:FdhD protein
MPVDLEALGSDFLYNENIIHSMSDIASVRVCSGGSIIDIWLNKQVRKPNQLIRTSGCSGGETSIDERYVAPEAIKPHNGFVITPQQIHSLIDQLLNSQHLCRKSGGVHTSAISDGESIILSADDVDRHNTLDKLSGKFLLEKINSAKQLVLTAGRTSLEMLQKQQCMGASILISWTSPTSLSVQMAEDLGVTLIGYARHDRFVVYAHPERTLTSIMGVGILSEAK